MNYTICFLEIVYSKSRIYLNKNGNKYYVDFTYYENEEKHYTHSRDLDFDEAKALFDEVSNMMIRALYSDSDKAKKVKDF